MKINCETHSYRDITKLSNEALLELLKLFVKVNHYDPHTTPAEYVSWERYTSIKELENELLGRMRSNAIL